MEYKDLDALVKICYKDIFNDVSVDDLEPYDRRMYIYEYFTDRVNFDNSLWENYKIGKVNGSSFQEIVDVFTKQRGVCNGIAQAYKLLLEKAGFQVEAVYCYDDGDKHMLCIVKQGDNWSFDDPTLGIIHRDDGKKLDYLDYDFEGIDIKKQDMQGIMTWRFYDAELGYTPPLGHPNLVPNKNNTALYNLPSNIRSSKYEIKESARHI